MAADWQRFCKGDGLRVEGGAIEVQLAGGRMHTVRVEDDDQEYRLWAVAAGAAAVEAAKIEYTQAWERNREIDLAGFRIDTKDRLIGESWVPKTGLTAEEFGLCVRVLAEECDRYEYQLTGKDSE